MSYLTILTSWLSNMGFSPIYIAPSSGVYGINVTRCTVIRNTASGPGGALYIQGQSRDLTLLLTHSAYNGNVNIDSSLFSLNWASEGGAIFIAQSLSASRSLKENNIITSSNFTLNGATMGGALSINTSTEVKGCSIDGNLGSKGALNLMRGDFVLRETRWFLFEISFNDQRWPTIALWEGIPFTSA